MIDTIVNSFLIPAVTMLGPPLATAAAGFGLLMLKRLAAKMKLELDATQEAALRHKVRMATLYVQQTYVKQLRLKKADGHLEPNEAIQAASKAFTLSLKALGKDGIKTLARVTGKGETAIREVIEEEVAALKLIPKASGNPPV